LTREWRRLAALEASIYGGFADELEAALASASSSTSLAMCRCQHIRSLHGPPGQTACQVALCECAHFEAASPQAPQAEPIQAPPAPHLRDDYQEVWQSGWRAGYRAFRDTMASSPAPQGETPKGKPSNL
jgi:hypothetical protein